MIAWLMFACGAAVSSFQIATVEAPLVCGERNDGKWLDCQRPSGATVFVEEHSNNLVKRGDVDLHHPVLKCRMADGVVADAVNRRVMCEVDGESYQIVARTTGMDAATFAPIANDLIRKVHVKAFDDACRKATGQPCAPLELP